jgi:thiopeptide-type bacteriocin biosynthesis protein
LKRVTLDTYEREVERYGGAEGIMLAERLFHADSDAVLELIERLQPGDAGSDERWRLTLRGLDQLLEDLTFDLDTKVSILEAARAGFAAELRSNPALRRQLGEKFRKERVALGRVLDPTWGMPTVPSGPASRPSGAAHSG